MSLFGLATFDVTAQQKNPPGLASSGRALVLAIWRLKPGVTQATDLLTA